MQGCQLFHPFQCHNVSTSVHDPVMHRDSLAVCTHHTCICSSWVSWQTCLARFSPPCSSCGRPYSQPSTAAAQAPACAAADPCSLKCCPGLLWPGGCGGRTTSCWSSRQCSAKNWRSTRCVLFLQKPFCVCVEIVCLHVLLATGNDKASAISCCGGPNASFAEPHLKVCVSHTAGANGSR